MPSRLPLGEQAEIVHGDRRAGDRRDIGMIVGRRNLDHVGADDVDPGELPQHRQDLRRARPAGDRRAGARREGRVEAVDVEGHVGLLAAGALGDRIGDVGGAHLLDLVAVDDLDPVILRRVGADADLDRAVGIDDALAHGARDEGAVVDALAVVGPGVLMRVELHQRERAMHCSMRLEQRPGDEVIAAERQQERAALQQLRRLALDRRRRLLVVAAVEQAIAIVDHRERSRTGRG